MVVDRENADAARINAHYLLFSLSRKSRKPGAGAPTRTQKLGFSILSLSVPAKPQGEVPTQPDGGEGLEMMQALAYEFSFDDRQPAFR